MRVRIRISASQSGRPHDARPAQGVRPFGPRLYFEKAISLSPFDPQRWAFYSYRALAHLFAGQFQSAVEWSNRATRVPHCHYWPFVHRVSALGHVQQGEDLKTASAELLQRKPEVSCGWARRRLFFIKNPAHLELYVEGLLEAGIPL